MVRGGELGGGLGRHFANSDSVHNRCRSTLREFGKLGDMHRSHAETSVLANTLHGLSVVFDRDELHQRAYHTLTEELLRHTLAWHTAKGPTDGEVPDHARDVVHRAVRSIMVAGYFYHAEHNGEVVVADVTEVVPVYRDDVLTHDVVLGGRDLPWTLAFIERPSYCFAKRRLMIASGAMRAVIPTRQLAQLRANWAKRDDHATIPTVYTTVSEQIKSNGGTRQWYGMAANRDVVQTSAVDIDRNFSHIVGQRADTIRRLDSLTQLARSNQTLGNVDDPREMPNRVQHTEHIISDGRDFTEAAARNSQPDTTTVSQQLVHAILFAYSVPPQALGENINSERTAASNRLTELAVTMFHGACARMRHVISQAFAGIKRDDGKTLKFTVVLRQFELNELMPVLTTDSAVEHMARAYGVDAACIDRKRLDAARCGEAQPSSKRPRTEGEAVSAERQRANAPH